jgi:hypothetical protein
MSKKGKTRNWKITIEFAPYDSEEDRNESVRLWFQSLMESIEETARSELRFNPILLHYRALEFSRQMAQLSKVHLTPNPVDSDP